MHSGQEDGKVKVVNDKVKIVITNLNSSKRPISAVADNLEVRNAKSITVKINNKVKFNLYMIKIEVYKKKLKSNKLEEKQAEFIASKIINNEC